MNIFAYITGIVTLLGFFLQLADTFPSHRQTRKSIVLLVFGLFLGSLLGSIKSIDLSINTPQNPITLLVTSVSIGLLILLIVIFVAIVFSPDPKKRKVMVSVMLGVGSFSVLVFLFGLTMMMATSSLMDDSSSENSEIKELTSDEVIALTNFNITRKNYDRSLVLLEELKDRIYRSDPRYGPIESKIDEIKRIQIQSSSQ